MRGGMYCRAPAKLMKTPKLPRSAAGPYALQVQVSWQQTSGAGSGDDGVLRVVDLREAPPLLQQYTSKPAVFEPGEDGGACCTLRLLRPPRLAGIALLSNARLIEVYKRVGSRLADEYMGTGALLFVHHPFHLQCRNLYARALNSGASSSPDRRVSGLRCVAPGDSLGAALQSRASWRTSVMTLPGCAASQRSSRCRCAHISECSVLNSGTKCPAVAGAVGT